MTRAILTGLLALSTLVAWSVEAADGPAGPDFDREIAPLLVTRCLDCHTGAKPKGGLDLSRQKTARAAFTPGKPEASPLWQRVHDNEMPPKKPLPEAEKAILKRWLASGAKWGTDPIDPFRVSTRHRAGYDWWSLQPVQRPAPPQVRQKEWARNPIDAFVLARLEEKGLTPSPEAEPRVLIRRLSFDLIGLPPSPEEVEAFVQKYAVRPQEALEELVDRLLASPHYGERWARHWLDIVRYGESDGFERNNPRPNAWPYRDWVVNALNNDLPYDEFARLQIAGDVLRPSDAAGAQAAGFLVAGIHNTVIGSNEVMRQNARQDELEDLVATVGQTFLGLTVQCARCHDHKFDPVGMTDYYRLAAALAGVEHGERKLTDAAREQKEAEIRRQLADIDGQIAALQQAARKQAGGERPKAPTLPVAPLARWKFEKDAREEMGVLHGTLKGGAEIAGGRLRLNGRDAFVITAPLKQDVREKTLEAWVALATLEQGGGGVITLESRTGAIFDAIVYAERQPKRWLAGSNFYRRSKDLTAAAENADPGQLIHMAIAYHADGQIALYRNGKPYGDPYRPVGAGGELQTYTSGDGRILFGLRHTGGGRGFLAGEVEEARLYDRALTAEEVQASAQVGPDAVTLSPKELLAALSADERRRLEELQTERGRLQQRLQTRSAAAMAVYTVRSQPKPPPTHVLERGDVQKKLDLVGAGGVRALGKAEFALPLDSAEGERRRKLAEWVARADNPLFARVIVNRLWHYHFGFGIVETPSDLGFNGSRPSHPELLDWLADELIRERFQLKAIHRRIVLSNTYRQSALPNPKAAAVDAGNRLLWRKSPVRLEAEVLRDAILATAGQLNRTMGGPGFQDVRTYFNSGTTFYEPLDPTGPEFQRRTLYRFSPRGERSTLLETFDCPDPSARAPSRAVTTTPLQALALLNSSFVLRMADRFAERVVADTKADDPETQTDRAYRLAFGRTPAPEERRRAAAFIGRHGLPAFCRVLLNSNEFIVIE
jgi:hypothetical protein